MKRTITNRSFLMQLFSSFVSLALASCGGATGRTTMKASVSSTRALAVVDGDCTSQAVYAKSKLGCEAPMGQPFQVYGSVTEERSYEVACPTNQAQTGYYTNWDGKYYYPNTSISEIAAYVNGAYQNAG